MERVTGLTSPVRSGSKGKCGSGLRGRGISGGGGRRSMGIRVGADLIGRRDIGAISAPASIGVAELRRSNSSQFLVIH